MKVLFLDFDGVLVVEHSGFSRTAEINLQFLLNKVPDLNIVVSSTWRHKGLDVVKDILKSAGIDPRKVIDITGNEQSSDDRDHRGYQVECWLKKHKDVTHFVIIDDNTDFIPLKDKLVKTNPKIGLTQANVEKALKILQE